MENSLLVEGAKRHIGLNTSPTWRYENRTYRPEDISALVLRKIKQQTNMEIGSHPVRDVVITHPQYFWLNQKEATKLAGVLARLNVVATITEPQAAAIAHGMREKAAATHKDVTVLVFDLGGGTFDVTLIQVGQNVFNMVGSGGDSRLGGMTWDHELEQMVKERYRIITDGVEFDDVALDQERIELRQKAVRAKEELSKKENHRFPVEGGGETMIMTISRSEFEFRCKPLVNLCLDRCQQLLQTTGYEWDKVDQVLMVGSSTKMPMIQRAVKETSGKDFIIDRDPKLMVAKGAAIWGHWVKIGLIDARGMESPEEPSGLEVRDSPAVSGRTAHGLGVLARKNGRDIIDILIEQNKPTPCIAEKVFYTTKDNATSILVPLYEGESDEPIYDLPVDEILIEGLPSRPQGSEVRVRLNIDVSGRLEVEVVETETGQSRKVKIERDVIKSKSSPDEPTTEERLRLLDELEIL
jgi:molecular chaperone DnaK